MASSDGWAKTKLKLTTAVPRVFVHIPSYSCTWCSITITSALSRTPSFSFLFSKSSDGWGRKKSSSSPRFQVFSYMSCQLTQLHFTAPVGRYSTHEFSLHIREQPVITVCGFMPVDAAVPLFPAGSNRRSRSATTVFFFSFLTLWQLQKNKLPLFFREKIKQGIKTGRTKPFFTTLDTCLFRWQSCSALEVQ